MKPLSFAAIASFVAFAFCGKKQENVLKYVDAKSSLHYKIVATIPSPADSARGIFSDSIVLDSTASVYSHIPFFNFPNVGATIYESPYGFSIGYINGNLPFAHFIFPGSAFSTVPRYFEVNTPYETHTSPGTPVPFFLGRSNGLDGWNHFVNNEYPPDSDPVQTETYTKIIFTKKMEYDTDYYDSTIVADGVISGYTIDRYSIANPDKYVHRLDFTLTFKALPIQD